MFWKHFQDAKSRSYIAAFQNVFFCIFLQTGSCWKVFWIDVPGNLKQPLHIFPVISIFPYNFKAVLKGPDPGCFWQHGLQRRWKQPGIAGIPALFPFRIIVSKKEFCSVQRIFYRLLWQIRIEYEYWLPFRRLFPFAHIPIPRFWKSPYLSDDKSTILCQKTYARFSFCTLPEISGNTSWCPEK